MIGDQCSHADVSLSEGEVDVDECTIECPKHGSEFALETGEALTLPALKPVPTYEVTVDGRRRGGEPDIEETGHERTDGSQDLRATVGGKEILTRRRR